MEGPVTINFQQSSPDPAIMRVEMSAFADPLEKVAPGIVGLINATQAVGEVWPQTLTRLVSQIDATDEQKTILLDQAIRAENNEPPAAIPTPAGSSTNNGLILTALAGLAFLL